MYDGSGQLNGFPARPQYYNTTGSWNKRHRLTQITATSFQESRHTFNPSNRLYAAVGMKPDNWLKLKSLQHM
jgi:hypothetical protein